MEYFEIELKEKDFKKGSALQKVFELCGEEKAGPVLSALALFAGGGKLEIPRWTKLKARVAMRMMREDIEESNPPDTTPQF